MVAAYCCLCLSVALHGCLCLPLLKLAGEEFKKGNIEVEATPEAETTDCFLAVMAAHGFLRLLMPADGC